MEQHHVHRLVVVADDDPILPIGVDLDQRRRARPGERAVMTMRSHVRRSPRSQVPSRSSTRWSWASRHRCSTCAPTSRSSARRSCRRTARASPTRSCRPTSAWPGASSRPGPRRPATSAGSRRASRELIAERCVGCMACVSACPDSAILAIAIPESDLDERIVVVRRGRGRSRAGDATRRARTSSTRRSTARSRRKRGLEPAQLRHLRRARSTARAARSASRSAPRSATTPCVMIDKRPRDAPGETARSSATRATCASSARCRRRRPSTATRRPSPT